MRCPCVVRASCSTVQNAHRTQADLTKQERAPQLQRMVCALTSVVYKSRADRLVPSFDLKVPPTKAARNEAPKKRAATEDDASESGREDRKKIQGWFKHMRTAVGKLYMTKSGQATQSLTARKKWQLENFAFLKAHIIPRTYAIETTPFDLEETDKQSQNEEPVPSIPTRQASPSASTSDRKTKPLVSKKSKIDDLLMKFLDRPTSDDVPSKQLETIAAAHASAPQQPDELTAFSQWIAARISGIPQDRWDDFQFAAMRMMQDYSRPRPNPDTSPTSQPSPMPPVQQQWSQYANQQQQWSQMQTWQQQWPQRQQWAPSPWCNSHRSPASPLSHRIS